MKTGVAKNLSISVSTHDFIAYVHLWRICRDVITDDESLGKEIF
jgi:hypothetical protein